MPIALTAAALLIGTAPAAAGMAPADRAEPTVAFTDTPSTGCDSIPSVSSLRVEPGSRVTLRNELGVPGSIEAGQAAELVIEDGSGASMRLRPGQHAIRLIPHCDALGRVEAAVVTVVTADRPGANPLPTTVDRGAGPDRGSSDARARGTAPAQDPRMALGNSATTAADSAGHASGEPNSPPDTGSGYRDGAIEDYVALPGPVDDRPSRVLAIIAGICVVGVTTAVLRTILSLRSPNVVRLD